ncbi:MAG: pitrilysin family protein, partial [Candidatus Neomarinimicrobiota bacterium]
MTIEKRFIMLFKRLSLLIIAGLMLILTGCPREKTNFSLNFEKYTLTNGLEVVLHQDQSDPIVAVAILYHVGSGREKPGKTGFAHLFEHMMFQESQHVGADQLFQKIQAAGGTLNGGTWEDGTVYYEVVPKNALEMVLWLEADRMGYLLSTVTPEAFANQQEVVMNEKRERYDNQPYGHTSHVIDKLLYPETHPYNWQTIGSLTDLSNASLEDVHEFFRHWYRSNNATLVIAGDYDAVRVREWVEKYFGEIERGSAVAEPVPQPVRLEGQKRYYREDDFARSPELNIVFPTVENAHPDAYALDFLGELLSNGKKAPLYKVIVEERQLAPSVSAGQNSSEIAGRFGIRVRAFPEASLAAVEEAIFAALAKFEQDGFTDKDVSRIKAGIETGFYNSIGSVNNKAFQLAQYNEFNGSPAFIGDDLKNILAVTS